MGHSGSRITKKSTPICGGSQSSLDTRHLLPTPAPAHLAVYSTEESPLLLLGPLSLVTFPCCLPFFQEGVQHLYLNISTAHLLDSLPTTLPLMSVDKETEAHSNLVTGPGSASKSAVST